MKSKTTLLTTGLTLLSSGFAHSATLLYSSDTDFGKGTNGGGNLISVAGWVGVYGRVEATAVNTTTATFASSSGDYNIGLQDASNGTVDEYIYFRTASGADANMDYFAHTSTGSNFNPFSPDLYSEGLTATWQKNSGDSYGNYFVTVLVGGTWYAADSGTGNDVASPIFDLLTANWVTISDSPSEPLGIGSMPVSSATLFAGETIDGFGFFANNLGVRTVRLDNIRINGVPEPSAILLGFFGLGTLLLRRRRA